MGRSESLLGALVKVGNELHDIVCPSAFLITLEFHHVWSQFLDLLPKIFKEIYLFFVSHTFLAIDSFCKTISSYLRPNNITSPPSTGTGSSNRKHLHNPLSILYFPALVQNLMFLGAIFQMRNLPVRKSN